jgi:prepilin signal peptidase PulO-like enzyme (type II secretory pathway)
MDLVYPILFVFGLIIGSFLNVVVLRFDTGASIARGRSKCFSCDKELAWHELLPLLSFLIQAGRCKGCRTKISWQYPVIEMLGGFAFVLAYAYVPEALVSPWGFFSFVCVSIVLCLYVAIGAYDMRHKVIPDLFSYAAAFASLGFIAGSYFLYGSIDLFQVIAGPALFLFFYFFWFVSRGTWMGLGDAKLALSIGWLLGLWGGIAAILLSFWIGAIVSLLVMLVQKLLRGENSLRMGSEIPFGPYILIGFLIAFVFEIDIQSILSFLAV